MEPSHNVLAFDVYFLRTAQGVAIEACAALCITRYPLASYTVVTLSLDFFAPATSGETRCCDLGRFHYLCQPLLHQRVLVLRGGARSWRICCMWRTLLGAMNEVARCRHIRPCPPEIWKRAGSGSLHSIPVVVWQDRLAQMDTVQPAARI